MTCCDVAGCSKRAAWRMKHLPTGYVDDFCPKCSEEIGASDLGDQWLIVGPAEP